MPVATTSQDCHSFTGREFVPGRAMRITPQGTNTSFMSVLWNNIIILAAFVDFPQPHLRELMEYVGEDLQPEWERVGVGLGVNQPRLDAIRSNFNDSSTRLSHVFTLWHDSQTTEYSWRRLAEVLCSRTVNRPRLLSQMYQRLST